MSGFTPPNEAQRLVGVGIRVRQLRKGPTLKLLHTDLYEKGQLNKAKTERLLAFLTPSAEAFDPIPEPGEDDWLGWRKGNPQSFKRYTRSRPNCANALLSQR